MQPFRENNVIYFLREIKKSKMARRQLHELSITENKETGLLFEVTMEILDSMGVF